MIELRGMSKLDQILACLDELLIFRDDNGNLDPIITGYNIYSAVPKSENSIVFSHIHESDAYKQAMILDLEKLEYSREFILANIREKWGVFLWELNFIVRDENRVPFPGLNIRNTATGSILDLSRYSGSTLEEYSELDGVLQGEDFGWELNLPFYNKKQLLELTDLFMRKSLAGRIDSWPGAYEVPVIVLGQAALIYDSDLPSFSPAKKLYLKQNKNEIYFIINENYQRFESHTSYKRLIELGFIEEKCLVNDRFLKRFIDKKRNV